jgi:hypothetical protein
MFQLAAGTFAVDPRADGARLEIRSSANGPRLAVDLPPGAYASPGPGWVVNPARTRYAFLDRQPGGTGGIVKMTIADRGGGLVQILVVAKRATLALVPTDAPLAATAVLGGESAAAAGKCGEVAFGAARCRAPSPTKIVCR